MRHLLACLALALSLLPATAAAATFSFVQEGSSVRLVLDTEGQAINAVEGTVRLIGTDVSVSRVGLGGSVMPLWAERPSTSSLRFAGIVPGSYEGSGGTVFAFTLAGAPGAVVRLVPEGMTALLADGAGTPAAVTAAASGLRLPAGDVIEPVDSEAPEFVEKLVARDPAIFDNAWFVAFTAQDGSSGVARFEVAEAAPGAPADRLAWQQATSPYLLADQSRRSAIWIKAVDGAGNEAVTRIDPPETRAPVAALLAGFAVLVVALGGAWVALRRRRLS